MAGRPQRIGILFAQFAAYHVDRCQAAARRLAGRAEVLAVEVATMSDTYAWAPSGEVGGARKQVLFPGLAYERIGRLRRWRAQFAALRGCHTIFIGVGYNEPDIIALAWALRAIGCRVVLMSESKFDDMPRYLLRELGKALLLLPFQAAVVGGRRHVAYMRLLGFHKRPVLTGYDAVDLARVRSQGGRDRGASGIGYRERPFVFVGRFVAKKNILFLLDAYARYRQAAGAQARGLVLVGGGELERAVRARVAALGLGAAVEITGFVDAPVVAERLAGALALLLPSVEEQWGLVVNEALAFGLPVVVSEAVGARDTLVRNLVNGFVVDGASTEGWAQAMAMLSNDELLWRRMSEASHGLGAAGDASRFAQAVEEVLDLLDAGPAPLIRSPAPADPCGGRDGG